MPVCPICKKELQEGEGFKLEYYAPQNWWVFKHTRQISEQFVADEHDPDDFSWEITREKGWCARANVQIPWLNSDLSGSATLPIRGTNWIRFR